MFDRMCFELAQYFLQDEEFTGLRTPENEIRLAQHIQTAIEDWIERERSGCREQQNAS